MFKLHIKMKNFIGYTTTEFLDLMMRILLSENVTGGNVRRAENFFPISESIIRLHVRELFLYPPPRNGRAREKSRRVSEQINNRFNESRVDKPGTRHGWRVRWRIKKKTALSNVTGNVKATLRHSFRETKSSIASRQTGTRYRIVE